MNNDQLDFTSAILTELGFAPIADESSFKLAGSQMTKLYHELNERDVNLGKIDMSKLTNKQINCLMGVNAAFHNNFCMCFLNENMELIITTQYRYQEEHENTRYRVSWVTMTSSWADVKT